MTRKELAPFSNEALAEALEQLEWTNYAGEAREMIKLAKLPLIIAAVCHTFSRFKLGENTYQFSMGSLIRSGPTIKAPPKNLEDQIFYYLDSVPVFLRDVKAKLEKLKQ